MSKLIWTKLTAGHYGSGKWSIIKDRKCWHTYYKGERVSTHGNFAAAKSYVQREQPQVYVLTRFKNMPEGIKHPEPRVFTTHQLANAAWQHVSNRYDWTLYSVTLEDTKAGATE